MFRQALYMFWHRMTLAVKEKRFAKRVIVRLLEAYSAVSAGNPDLSDRALYREVILHAQRVYPFRDPFRVDRLMALAEGSIDDWTASGRRDLGFREIVHFLVLSEYRATGQKGAVVSFGAIVDSLVPADW